ncbi:helix-turn-helix domain-containing protein [Fulvivirga ligni]|uniref:helix-turn-helix domain-containing protein n=1 Tax=Fulvivirga ligni TaxID=2904246 RepID=UPI001F303B62|nr:helix-turn-helix domain-containing protein [Fulvivirga ligni]UII20305.1 helix-turn-helix domain-containing protein [Fulvivirga ligni]
MIQKSKHTLVDPQTGNLAFKLYTIQGNNPFDHIQRLNYYSLIWVQSAGVKLKANFSECDIEENTLLAFAPYQPFMLMTDGDLKARVIHFHPDFFCIHKHHKEVACHGVLFNNIYDPPALPLDQATVSIFNMQMDQMENELQSLDLAHYELMISYLKIFLITASRLKAKSQPEIINESSESDEPFVLQNLKDCIEEHYKSKHSASEYADLLAISTKALAKLTRRHFNKTLTDLISERIIIEAKRELYLTSKTVKEIAYELGYNDEYYFSRFFKKNAEVSPQVYRETVGFAKMMVG